MILNRRQPSPSPHSNTSVHVTSLLDLRASAIVSYGCYSIQSHRARAVLEQSHRNDHAQ